MKKDFKQKELQKKKEDQVGKLRKVLEDSDARSIKTRNRDVALGAEFAIVMSIQESKLNKL